MAAPLILGINAYHADAAACIVRDGKLLAAAEEERFRRIKHWAGFPSQAIQYCLREAKVELADATPLTAAVLVYRRSWMGGIRASRQRRCEGLPPLMSGRSRRR
jgi:predicted NodU family carbamoyl transferase